MNKKQAKTMRKGYRDAGAVYWTKDMEKAIRKIHARSRIFFSIAIIEAVFVVGLILKVRGVL